MEEVKWLIVGMATLSILSRIWYIVSTLSHKKQQEDDNIMKAVLIAKLLSILIWFYIIIKLI